MHSVPAVPGHLPADLVGVPPPWFFGHVQTTPVLREAAVRPVGRVETKGASVVAVSRVLDGDGAGDHGDDAAAACILLSLGERRKEGGVYFYFNYLSQRIFYQSFSTFSILIFTHSLNKQEYWHKVCICGVKVCSIFSNRVVGGKLI